jgi:sortase A
VRVANIILNVMSLLLVVAGLGLIGTFFFGSPIEATGTAEEVAVVANTDDFNVPVLNVEEEPPAAEEPAAPDEKAEPAKAEKVAGGPKDKTLRITVPKMARVRDTVIPYAAGNDEEELRTNTAIHLEGTGYPWEEEANVYVAGHRLGYLNTKSFLAFYDLNKLENGDKVFVTDSTGKRYTYRVFKNFIVDPSDVFITQPIKDKNILTLQTCTLPDYSQRLIVQAERVA